MSSDARSRPGRAAAGGQIRRCTDGQIGRPHVCGQDARYLGVEPAGRIEDTVASAVRSALASEVGSALVFLPGVGEIRRVEERLANSKSDIDVAPLYGDLSPAEQHRHPRRLLPATARWSWATSIAETSLTIEGVRVVVDSGLMRVPRCLAALRHDPAGHPACRRPADQRQGRAGRLEPGICYRLWPETSRPAALHADPRRRPRSARSRLGRVGRQRYRQPALADAAARCVLGHGARSCCSISPRSIRPDSTRAWPRHGATRPTPPACPSGGQGTRGIGTGPGRRPARRHPEQPISCAFRPGSADVDLRHHIDLRAGRRGAAPDRRDDAAPDACR